METITLCKTCSRFLPIYKESKRSKGSFLAKCKCCGGKKEVKWHES